MKASMLKRNLSFIGFFKLSLILLLLQFSISYAALTVVPISSVRADLTWTDTSTDGLGFAIERAPDSSGVAGKFVQITTTAANIHSYNDTSLSEGATYCYRIRANASYSNTVSVTTYSGPPSPDEVGPRYALTDTLGSSLKPGTYSRKRFTTQITFAYQTGDTGVFTFTDCEFVNGFDAVYGADAITRKVTLDHSRVLTGLYFTRCGQNGWVIRWSYLLGDNQALRPSGYTAYETITPTPFLVEDCIVENTSTGTPAAHVEAMQSMGGNQMKFIRVRFITPGPSIDNVTGQTAAINHCGSNCLFEDCEFLTPRCSYYMIYTGGPNVVFRRCRISKGRSDYIYPTTSNPAFYNCTDYETADLLSINTPENTSIAKPITVPKEFAVSQNYPNPFNPSTKINYFVTTKDNIRLVIYDLLGRQIRTLVDGMVAAGPQSVFWDGRDTQGKTVSSGVYFYSVEHSGQRIAKQMVLIK